MRGLWALLGLCAATAASADQQVADERRNDRILIGLRAGDKWQGEAFHYGAGAFLRGALLELSVRRAGVPVSSAMLEVADDTLHVWGRAEACWLPASKAVVWRVQIKSDSRGDPDRSELVVLPMAARAARAAGIACRRRPTRAILAPIQSSPSERPGPGRRPRSSVREVQALPRPRAHLLCATAALPSFPPGRVGISPPDLLFFNQF